VLGEMAVAGRGNAQNMQKKKASTKQFKWGIRVRDKRELQIDQFSAPLLGTRK